MILGFDFGTKKIGIATGQLITQTASPLRIIPAAQGEPDWTVLNELVHMWQPEAFVVGLALNEDLSESKTSKLARAFAKKLQANYHIKVHFVSEYLTSSEARRLAKASSKNEKVDAIAAALILETWLKGDAHVG